MTETILIGLASGLAAVAFQKAIHWLIDGVLFPTMATKSLPSAMGVFAMMTGGALLSGFLMVRFCPEAAGSGIPQVKRALARGETEYSWKVAWVKFVGGVAAIGTGSSMGREGPTVHICSVIASKISQAFGESPGRRVAAVCAGAAAGLAAAFNSPLAGVTFVMEEIAGGRQPRHYVARTLIAAATAVVVVFILVGDFPALPLGHGIPMSWTVIGLTPVVAVVGGLSGLLFQIGTLRLRGAFRMSFIPPVARPAAGAFLGCIVAYGAFLLTGRMGIFGLGEEDLLATLNLQIPLTAAVLLLVAKLVTTVLCYSSGGCGGIFAPILVFGAMCGTVVGGIAGHVLELTPGDQTLLSIIGMTAALSAVVRAPLTSILIVMEMTRQIHVLPALMVAAVLCVTMSRMAFRYGIYDALLAQDGKH